MNELRLAPPPGTPLKCALAGGIVTELSHSGVCLGGGRVAELEGDGHLKAVTASEFLNGGCREWDVAAVRTGFRIYAACDAENGEPLASPAVAEAARVMLGKAGRSRVRYDLLWNNCHRFTAQCVERGGGGNSAGWRAGGVGEAEEGVWMLGRLEEVVSRVLNGGRAMRWVPIRPSAEGFRYAVTPGKRIQRHLLREGALALVACAAGIAVTKTAGQLLREGQDRG